MVKVSAILCDSYEQDPVLEAVHEALARIGRDLPRGGTVLIKPNIMAQNTPDQHTITHPAVIDAICALLSARGCRIRIGESAAFYQKGMTELPFRTSGIERIARKYGAALLPFERSQPVPIPSGLPGGVLYVARDVLEADLVINACKLKTHSAMRFSGAVKNMFGCVPGGYKQRIHSMVDSELALADVFIDIHARVGPMLSIMDAIYGLDGGPSAMGKPVKTSRIFASENAASLDIVASGMIGYEPVDVPALVAANARGMINGFGDVEVLGNIASVRFRHIRKGPFGTGYDRNSVFVRDTYVVPAIDPDRCTACGDCVEACPAGAVLADPGRPGIPNISSERCINCYYCMAVCREQAIRPDFSAMNRLVLILRRMLKL